MQLDRHDPIAYNIYENTSNINLFYQVIVGAEI